MRTAARPEEIVIGNYSVYPNPATDRVTVQFEEGMDVSNHIVLFDMMGKQYSVRSVHETTNSMELDLSDLRSGHYLIRIEEGDQVRMFHIIKE